ncbi:recombinase family protein [Caulobacter sp. NIBR2454]|uniref:recombinase family protein n=1 Tax=Caulobacter sp. NIBR2454 TaxID=3015996 RepID=UPI0022B6A69F|nr:recombinase family protein [Caulobacter sp. NIBR2454]
MGVAYVAYYRVSTAKQGASGLGLGAQRLAVSGYVASQSGELIAEFEEIESGKGADRPQLRYAMDRCKLTGATLLIAKLDRLSRNVHFLSGLMEQGVPFVACDMPGANSLTVHIMAAVAQQEREAVSARTKSALSAIRSKLALGEEHFSARSGRQVSRLGNPNGLKVRRPDLGTAALRSKAEVFAASVLPLIGQIQSEGPASLSALAKRLNEMRVQTARGSEWTPMAVKRVLDRAAGAMSE